MTQTNLKTTFSKLYEAITLCKPRNVFQFASKYLQNSKQSPQYVEELQAYLTLPFLLYNADEFNSTAAVIYASYLSGKSILLTHLCTNNNSNPIVALYGSYAQGGSYNNILSCVDQSALVLRESVDGQGMMEIIQNFDLVGYGYVCNTIDEVGLDMQIH
ncbi:hypothetical protein EON65_35655 [archaeon]|nr:MAG: hypothetical protein EON65_35655 [archaeon]